MMAHVLEDCNNLWIRRDRRFKGMGSNTCDVEGEVQKLHLDSPGTSLAGPAGYKPRLRAPQYIVYHASTKSVPGMEVANSYVGNSSIKRYVLIKSCWRKLYFNIQGDTSPYGDVLMHSLPPKNIVHFTSKVEVEGTWNAKGNG